MKLKTKDLVRHVDFGLGIILSIEYDLKLTDGRTQKQIIADRAFIQFESGEKAILCDSDLHSVKEQLSTKSPLYWLLHPEPPPVYDFEPLPDPVLPDGYVRGKTYGSQFVHLSDEEKQAMIPSGELCYTHVRATGNETYVQGRLGHEQREFKGFYPETKGVYCPFYNYTEYGTLCCDYLDLEFFYDEEKVQKHFKISDARQMFYYPFGIFDDMYKLCQVKMALTDEDWDIMEGR